MIIDAHVHLKGSVFEGDNSRIGVTRLVEALDQAGIQRAIVNNLSNPDDNIEIISECFRYPDRLTPFVLELPFTDRLHKIRDYVKAGARGLGEIYVQPGSKYTMSSYLSPLIQEARNYQIPILFHTGDFSYTPPLIIAGIISRNPDVKFILGHMGSLHYALDAIELIKSYPNVFTDTSGMTSPIILRRAVYECGAKKLLFGSDYPFWHPEVEICRIYASGFTKQDELAILGENAARVFNL